MEHIDKNKASIDMIYWSYDEVPILELKRWVDMQIENGKNTVSLDLSWGHYHDLDEINLIASE